MTISLIEIVAATEKILVLSTSHMQQSDERLFVDHVVSWFESPHSWKEARILNAIVYPLDYGWLVRIMTADDSEDSSMYAKPTAEFRELMDVCREAGLWWVRFDADADTVPTLPVYDW